MNLVPGSDMFDFPKFPLLQGPTRIEEIDNLGKLKNKLCGVRLFIKRDDHMSIGGGGNKLRKLEFLLGEARTQGADTIITVGALQSNHARLTAAASARAGLKCELVLSPRVYRDGIEYCRNGNFLLSNLFGANITEVDIKDRNDPAATEKLVNKIEASLKNSGQKSYFCPTGGSTAVGALGYALCANEIAQQSKEMGIDFAQVVVPNGSGGTHAGLAAGFAAIGMSPRMVKSYAVVTSRENTLKFTLKIAQETAKMLKPSLQLTQEDIDIDDSHLGEDYGIPTKEMLDAVRIMARSEGVLLDPVYSGKAFAGLLHDIQAGKYASGQNVLFLMTGGIPALFAYRSTLDDSHW
jgi:D-cysteine desulfhydrase